MSWELYFGKNKGRAVRPLYTKAIEMIDVFEVGRSIAVDVGCGAGIETADLSQRGWNVVAIDREPASIAAVLQLVSKQANQRLKTVCSPFEELTEIPTAEFIYSYHALPFCKADHLDHLWNLIRNAIKPNGIFAGSFFGMNDEWVKSGHTTGVSQEWISQHFSDFEILFFQEIDEVGNTTLNGPKHWHFMDIIARKK